MKNQSWPKRLLQRELSRNPFTVPCLLFRERVLLTDHGVLSYMGDKELVVLLDGGINGRIGGYFWYGHVLRVALAPEAAVRNEQGWAALIVPSDFFVDAPTVDLVFQRLKYALVTRAAYSPPTVQDPDDVFAMRATFDDACLALAEMIRRFNPKLREEQVIFDPPDPYGHDDFTEKYVRPGPIDMRSIDIYGLHCSKDQNGGWPRMPEYQYPVEDAHSEDQA